MSKICILLGHPRSGSSFLHRFMLEHYSGFTGKRLEDMFFLPDWPGYLKPLKGLVRKLPMSWVYPPEIHHTGMRCWECDDIAFSIHHKAGYLSWLYGHCRKMNRFIPKEFDMWVSGNEDKILDCWGKLHRNEFVSEAGSCIFSKSFILTLLFEEFISRYPNAKAVILTRTPVEVVPSTISLVNSVFRRLHISRCLSKTMVDNLYQTIALFYRRTASLLANPSLKGKFLHLEYTELFENFSDTCNRISHYLKSGSWDKEAVALQSVRQSKRQSKHRYDLDTFGLNREQIERDFFPCA